MILFVASFLFFILQWFIEGQHSLTRKADYVHQHIKYVYRLHFLDTGEKTVNLKDIA